MNKRTFSPSKSGAGFPGLTVRRLSGGLLVSLVLLIHAPAAADEPVILIRSFQQGVNGYTGTSDTWIREWDDEEAVNRGGEDHLQTYGHAVPPAHRSNVLIRFDRVFGAGGVPLSVSGSDILNATLTVTVYDAINRDNGSLRVRPMLTAWEAGRGRREPALDGETTAGFRFFRADGNYDPGDHWGNTGARTVYPVAGIDFGDYLDGRGPWPDRRGEKGVDAWPVELDVTAAVRAWADGISENHGFYLSSEGCWWQFYRMYSSNWKADPEWRPKLTIKYHTQVATLLVELQSGSQFVSANLEPLEQDLRENIFAGLIADGSLSLVRDSAGRSLQRIAGQWLNPIGSWTSTEGYLVRLDQADTLRLEGEIIHPQTPIELEPGYQFVAYFPNYKLTADDAFERIKDQGLVSVRDSAGRTLRKEAGIWVDDIGEMEAGRGYLVRMNGPATLIYPEEEPLTLFEDGLSRAVVVTGDTVSPVAQLAVEELVEHFKRSTGVELEVVSETDIPATEGHTRIFVGVTSALGQSGLDIDSLAPDAFYLRAAGRDIYIAGRETDGDYHQRSGYNGTLYGVYEFLERFLGVRWLWPGETGTHVPRHHTVQVPPTDTMVAMRLDYRDYWINHLNRQMQQYEPRISRLAFSQRGLEDYYRELLLFMRRHRLGWSRPKPWYPHQNLAANHFADHPEWFAMNEAGVRTGPNMCVTNQDLHQFHTEPQPGCCEGIFSVRGLNIINLEEADHRSYCHCAECLAWDEPQPPGWSPHITSNRYARYAAAVRDLGRIKNPGLDFLVVFLAYMDRTHAPTIDIDLTGVHVGFCPWFSGFNPNYPKPAADHEFFKQTWRGWHNTGATMWYRPNYLLFGYVMPHLSTWQTGDMLRHLADHGSRGVDFDSLHAHWAAKGPMLYLHLRMAAKPEMPVADVREEYFSAFGPAAGKVEEYFDYWEHYSLVHAPGGGVCRTLSWQAAQLYPPQSFTPAITMLNQALELARQADSEEYAERVAYLQAGLEHARLAAYFTGLLGPRGALPTGEQQLAAARAALYDLIAFRRQNEHLMISDYVAAAINENRSLPIDALIETAAISFQQGVNGYTGTSDTWIREWHDEAAVNHGGGDYLQTYGHAVPPAYRSNVLIRFDRIFGAGGIPSSVSGGDILNATLTVTLYEANNQNNGSLRVRPMLTAWEAGRGRREPALDGETTAGFRFFRADGNYDPGDHWGNTGTRTVYPVAGIDFGDYLDGRGPWPDRRGEKGVDAWPVELDVTAAVRAWADGISENHGFYLSSEGCWWQFYRMYSSNWEADPEWRPKLLVEYAQ